MISTLNQSSITVNTSIPCPTYSFDKSALSKLPSQQISCGELVNELVKSCWESLQASGVPQYIFSSSNDEENGINWRTTIHDNCQYSWKDLSMFYERLEMYHIL